MAAPGTSLGPYELLGSIGAGGMGEVYRARDPRLSREVAIKILPARFAADPDRLRRFEQEARAAAALSHPNILAIYDIGAQANGSPYIVTELLEGDSLRDRLRSGPLPLRKAVDYASQIARGLAAAHDKHIVHRDLKPDNIFITRDGRAKILDFGLAKLTERNLDDVHTSAPTEEGTSPGTVVGTVGYMAPEQVRGQAADHRCDIFAFGAILYEMLSGKRAFRGETSADTMSAILKEDPPDLTETNRAVPPAIERIVEHCLEKHPDQRFHSASDIAFGLEAFSGSSAGAIAASAPAAARARLNRRALYATVGTAGLVIACAVTWWLGVRSARPPLPNYKPITFRSGRIGNARFGPDGQTVFYSASWEGGSADIYSGRIDSLGERSMGFPNTELLAISSAGEIAIRDTTARSNFASRGVMSVVPTAGGAPRPVMDDVADIDWAADGKQMAVVRFDPSKEEWRLEYPVGKVLLAGAVWISAPRISRDGKQIAFFDHGNSIGDDRGDVAMVDLNGKKTTLSTGWSSLQGLDWSPDGQEIWFSATSTGVIHNLYAVSTNGKLRRLASMPADVVLQDVASDGRVLLRKQAMHFEIYGGDGQAAERKLDWLDWSHLDNISQDGKYVLFDEEGEGGGHDYTVYMRPTDGSPAIALGRGFGVAFSPDNKWALTATLKSPAQFILQPTGAGEARTVTHDQIDHGDGIFLPDAKRVLFYGREPGRPARLFLLDLDTGATRPITPEGVAGYALSPDGKYVVAKSKQAWLRWPIESGDPTPVTGLKAGETPIAWTADGRQLYLIIPAEARPRRVYLFDIATGKRTLWKSLGPADWTGAGAASVPYISGDGKHYVYTLSRALADLYVVTGLK
ncbi:MAG TPA: WD40 repeat domain-containing serine/threonine protein kinase [Terriglobales bacterium]|nr:WD40 repeat domain-containing serine/threonine protein kinase [Terriglobales bacterium]